MARIVVVEDDAALRQDLSERLIDWGHAVTAAADAHHGLALIEQERPDIVLCDVHMPGGSGFDLARCISMQPTAHAETSFLLCSSSSGSATMIDGINAGADDFVAKPLDYTLLKAKIDACVRKQEGRLQQRVVNHVPLRVRHVGKNALCFSVVAGLAGMGWVFIARGLSAAFSAIGL